MFLGKKRAESVVDKMKDREDPSFLRASSYVIKLRKTNFYGCIMKP